MTKVIGFFDLLINYLRSFLKKEVTLNFLNVKRLHFL